MVGASKISYEYKEARKDSCSTSFPFGLLCFSIRYQNDKDLSESATKM
jgi:hypothetical protein